MEGISEIIERMRLNTTSRSSAVNDFILEPKYECKKCNDSTWELVLDDEGHTVAKRCICYPIKLARSLWIDFGVKPEDVKKLSEYKPYDDITKDARDKAIEYIKEYDGTKSLGLFGQAGGGKTHIIVAIGAALINRDTNPIPVVYMPYIEVMRELKSNAMDEEYYNKILWKYQRAKLLIIDDLFKDKVKKGKLTGELSEADMKHIYPIINYRYLNKMPMLVSSECNPMMLMDLDEALAGRIIEMCGNNITIFNNSKYNYRMRNFVKEG